MEATEHVSSHLIAQAEQAAPAKAVPAQTQAETHAGEKSVEIGSSGGIHPEAAQAEGGKEGGSLFDELIGHLADSHEFHAEPLGTVTLPYIFWDADGSHVFFSQKSILETGNYTLGHHAEPIRKDGKKLSFDMSVTSNVVFMAIAALILFFAGRSAAKKAKKSMVPTGLRNMLEVLIVFIRDEVVYPNVEKEYADKLMPFFLSIFFFILIANLLGLVPWGHTATGAVSVTAALAICTFVVTQVVGVRAMGVKNFLKHLTGGLIDMDIPFAIKILLIIIMVPIEIMGLFTKPFALAVRLFANMTAGHIVIVSLIGLAFLFKSYLVGAFVSVPFALFIDLLELFVGLLQAYVFTILSALFIGMMAHSEHEEHQEDHGHPHPQLGEHLAPTSHTV